MTPTTTESHPFLATPHRTLLTLTVPVLFSLIAEPLTGIVDTIFVKQLGSAALSALGIGTVALSSLFWLFNFLAIGAQTEVAQAMGAGRNDRASQITSLALALSTIFGISVLFVLTMFARPIAAALAAEGQVLADAVEYIRIRAWGAPAVLLSATTFGALRGLQDMRTPLWIAVGVNILNMVLDAVLVTGVGPVPKLGITGVALASTVSLWLGAIIAMVVVQRRIGFSTQFGWHEARNLLQVGGDLFIRTGSLLLFMALATRAATAISEDGGAANQAVRQVFLLSALGLDAFAITTQSLVGYFYGAGELANARRVINLALRWGVFLGILLGAGMWASRSIVIDLMVPQSAVALFLPAWAVVALSLPIGSVTYVTDGAHWGTGDFRYLRNAMLIATVIGIGLILLNIADGDWRVAYLWIASFVWTVVRGIFGVLRVWPGIRQAPLNPY